MHLFLIDPAPPFIYTLSLHDALPIFRSSAPASRMNWRQWDYSSPAMMRPMSTDRRSRSTAARSEEHTSELQSHSDLVCRLLLEKKKTIDSIKSDRNEKTKRIHEK